MYMSESSVMIMGSKLILEQLSPNQTGVAAKYHWRGKMMEMTIDLSETGRKQEPNKLKEWETDRGAKIRSISWYRMWFEISPDQNGTIAKLSISYLQLKTDFIKHALSFLPIGIATGV